MTTKQVMRGFTVVLMILVGAVFVAGPAGLLAKLTPDSLDTTFWIIVVFIYYILATLLPVDKIIGKIYPLFAAALLFMAVGILVMLYVHHPVIRGCGTDYRILIRKQPCYLFSRLCLSVSPVEPSPDFMLRKVP